MIKATLVKENKRLTILPKYTGRFTLATESHILNAMREFCSEYQGGYWYFYELSNNAFYMAPGRDEKLTINCAGNFYNGVMSADAAGIVATLVGLNRLLWKTRDEELINLFYAVREFAIHHEEGREIMQAID